MEFLKSFLIAMCFLCALVTLILGVFLCAISLYDIFDYLSKHTPHLYADVICVLLGAAGLVLGYSGIREMCKK